MMTKLHTHSVFFIVAYFLHHVILIIIFIILQKEEEIADETGPTNSESALTSKVGYIFSS